MADDMTIINPNGKATLHIDSDNNIVVLHDCVFNKFEDNEMCSICSITLGDFILAQDPNNPKVPIITGEENDRN